MIGRFEKRLEALERSITPQKPSEPDTAERRFVRGALIALSPEELHALRDYKGRSEQDPNTKPTPQEQKALEAFNRNFEEYKSTGKLAVNGWPVEDFEMNEPRQRSSIR